MRARNNMITAIIILCMIIVVIISTVLYVHYVSKHMYRWFPADFKGFTI